MRGCGAFRAEEGFGANYRRFFDLDLGQSFAWFEHDGERLATQRFEPARPAAGSAVIVHGYYDHVGLYGHLIRYLLGRGLRVLAYDQQGHGLSTGPRATIDSFDRYVSALSAVLGDRCAGMTEPIWLVGQSMGASVVAELMDRGEAGRDIGPIVLLAPLVRPASWHTSRIVYAVGRHVVREVGRKFVANTENPEFSALLQADPLQARTLPVEWVTAMIDWKRRFERRRRSGRRVVVVQGGRDGTVDARYNVKVLKRRYDVTLLHMPAARHHLVNEEAGIRQRMWRFLDRVADF